MGFYDAEQWQFAFITIHCSVIALIFTESLGMNRRHYVTRFPLTFWYFSLWSPKNQLQSFSVQLVTHCCDNKQLLSSTDPVCCANIQLQRRISELHQSENLPRKDTCKSSKVYDSPWWNSGSGTQQDEPSCAFWDFSLQCFRSQGQSKLMQEVLLCIFQV